MQYPNLSRPVVTHVFSPWCKTPMAYLSAIALTALGRAVLAERGGGKGVKTGLRDVRAAFGANAIVSSIDPLQGGCDLAQVMQGCGSARFQNLVIFAFSGNIFLIRVIMRGEFMLYRNDPLV